MQNATLHNSQRFLLNSAQVCSAGSRILVQHTVAEKFMHGLREALAKWTKTMGDPSLPSTLLGPLADNVQNTRVRKFISDAEEAHTEVLFGGTTEQCDGNFITPTVFLNPDKSSRVYQKEIFGPVVVIETFKTAQEAIEIANSSTFGLAGR